MPIRNANAVWEGDLRSGTGKVKVGSGLFEGPYSFSSRFESGAGTNPEELIGAAHAGCFSMALAGALVRAGYSPKRVHTDAKVHIDKVGEGFTITSVELITEADVPGIDEEEFVEQAKGASKNCPVSRALSPDVKVQLNAKLAK